MDFCATQYKDAYHDKHIVSYTVCLRMIKETSQSALTLCDMTVHVLGYTGSVVHSNDH